VKSIKGGWCGMNFYYGRSLTSGNMTFCCIKYFKGAVEKEVISKLVYLRELMKHSKDFESNPK